MQWIAGVDEAGRGPLAGPVVAAAVIFQRQPIPDAITDSKALSAKKREQLFETIHTHADAVGIGLASAREIDTLNIHTATLLAMRRAIEQLALRPTTCLVDGKFVPDGVAGGQAIIGGDAKHAIIGAASIIAKVHRDRLMLALDIQYPNYGFAQHKGYPTAVHKRALRQYGPTPAHRQSFKPVAECTRAG